MQVEPVRITGIGNRYTKPITVEIEMDGKFINAFVLVRGFRTGSKFCIAVQSDSFRFYYAKKYIAVLEDPDTVDDSWYVQVHTYYRV